MGKHKGEKRITNRPRAAVGTWRSERQPIVQTSWFGGDEEIAEDTQSDDEGEKNHSCHRETHESSETVQQSGQVRVKELMRWASLTVTHCCHREALPLIRLPGKEFLFDDRSVT
ncbi:hypothetical protein EYF80_030244 [Liparis tanakae]|uniref:Uncharacterized protein n=1 Tax=Liparis tanakae TaxID=230148 RepID=A0A4Z2H229_9TELE|nr:hypothetical protein EYF80_030244 [Liparis tanakae]